MTISLHRRAALRACGLMGTAVLAACAPEADMLPDPTRGRRPDGRVELRMVQAAYYGSAATGGGVLEFRGRRHRFRVSGGGVGGLGVSEVEAWGEVYDLRELSRFPGAYAEARSGFAVGAVGQGQLWLQNEAGVVMQLRARREGLMLSLGADAMVIEFE